MWKKLFLSLLLVCPLIANSTPISLGGFETGDGSELYTDNGASYSTSIVRNGIYSSRINAVAGAVKDIRIGKYPNTGIVNNLSVGTVKARFGAYVATAPASGAEEWFGLNSFAGNDKIWARLNSARNVELYDSTGTLVGTGTTVVSLNTWHTIIFTAVSSATGAYFLSIDGVTELSGTMDTGSFNFGQLILGKRANVSSQTVDYYFDDWLIDDTNVPPNGGTVKMKADANGSTFQWGSGSGSSNYTQITEIPTDNDTTYIKSTGTAGDTAYLNVESTSTAGVSGTINAVKAWQRVRENASDTSSNTLKIKSSASTQTTTARDEDATYSDRFLVSSVDPDTGVAWTTTGLDSAEIGSVEANAVAMRGTTFDLFVDFSVPAATNTPTNTPTSTNTPVSLTNFTGFETGSVDEANAVGGGFSSSTVHTGLYSLRINPTTSSTQFYTLGIPGGDGVSTTFAEGTSCFRFWFYIATAPGSSGEEMLSPSDSGNTGKAYYVLNSTRTISLYDSTGTLIGTSSTAIPLITWTELKGCVNSGTSAVASLFINGASAISGSGNLRTGSNARWRFGKVNNTASQSIDLFYDDVMLDKSHIPVGGTTVKLSAISNTGTAQWTFGTNSSNYAEINEVPPNDDVTYIKNTTSVNQTHIFNLQSTTTGGISGLINGVKSFGRVREDSSVTSSDILRFIIGGTNVDTSARNHSTSYSNVTKVSWVDPNDSNPYTTSDVDGITLGIKEENAVAMRATSLDLFVDFATFTPTPTSTNTNTPVNTFTNTPTVTNTFTNTPTVTNTFTPTPAASLSKSLTTLGVGR